MYLHQTTSAFYHFKRKLSYFTALAQYYLIYTKYNYNISVVAIYNTPINKVSILTEHY